MHLPYADINRRAIYDAWEWIYGSIALPCDTFIDEAPYSISLLFYADIALAAYLRQTSQPSPIRTCKTFQPWPLRSRASAQPSRATHYFATAKCKQYVMHLMIKFNRLIKKIPADIDGSQQITKSVWSCLPLHHSSKTAEPPIRPHEKAAI